MCHRIFYSQAALERARRQFETEWVRYGFTEDLTAFASGTVNPADLAVIIGSAENSAVGFAMREARWGFAGKEGNLVINARSESIFAKPMFSSSALYRRCLVPAEEFFEWDVLKNKVGFREPGKDVMYLAGLWKPSEEGLRFVVITAPANASAANVHDRMPLLIDEADARAWILDASAAQELLKKPLPDLVQLREEEQLSLL